MRKPIILLTALGLVPGLMTGCGESAPLLAATDYELDLETKETSRSVAIGDTPEVFLEAYGEYDIFTSVEGGDYQALDADAIPFGDAITTLLPTFFIDGLPVDPDAFCEENEIDKASLLSFLSDEDYLRTHTVVYDYMIFTWTDGVIADIRSESMDYNEDAAFFYTEPAN